MELPKFQRDPTSYFQGIPSFVQDEPYVSAFGIQWVSHAKTQLDSHTGLNITRDRLIRMFGPLYPINEKKNILEAGCGAGRFTEILVGNDSLITAIDLSIAVAANHKNNGHNANLRIARASITELPFDDGQFDIVFCPGVVQHTPDPNMTIQELYKHVRPGGWLIFDQYRYNLSSILRVTWLYRFFLKRLNPELGLQITDFLVKIWLPLHRVVSGKRFLEILLFRVSPITAHYTGYPNLKQEDQVAWARLNTHDNLTDYYKHLTYLKKMRRTLNLIGSENQTITIMPYTLEIRCQKPIIENATKKFSEPKIIDARSSGTVSG
jgi:2-polyprenyl-3-methyl-5-hydroxy-6-metoxy-1,4-benzoquinol methylase